MFTFPVAHFGGELSFTIDQAVRFNDNDSAFLKDSAYNSSPTSSTDCTLSFWVKRCNLSTTQCLFFGGDGAGSTWEVIRFESDDQFRVGQASSAYDIITTQVFRDVAAWSNFVIAFDTDNGTAGDRIKIYHNGSRITDFSLQTNPSSGYVTNFNSGGGSEERLIGFQGPSSGGSNAADCYLAEINFVDGLALTPDSFAETTTDGVYQPVKYAGAYGTNGFRITGADSSDLGADQAGSNDFTSSGLAAADQMSDSPTANHCTLNPLWVDGYTLSDGNLVTNQSGDAAAIGTMAFDPTDSQGFYFEAKVTTAASFPNVGIRTADSCSKVGAVSSLSGNSTGRFAYTGSNGQFNDEGSGSSYGSTWAGTADKVIGVFVKAGELFFSVDGTIQNSGTAAKTGLTGLMVPTVFYDAGSGTQAAWEMRFDASDWSTTPSGYKALTAANLADPSIPDPSEYFQSVQYATTTSAQDITFGGNSDLAPDWLWFKSSSTASDHFLFDKVRGVLKTISSNDTNPEVTSAGSLTAFGTDGFSLGDGGSDNDINGASSSANFMAWGWAAGGTSGSSNTDGSIHTTATSVNTTAGFSISTYTGTGSNATVGHGLGVAPSVILVKERTSGSVENWEGFFSAIGPTKTLSLNKTAAEQTSSTRWNDTSPTSSVFSIGTATAVNDSGGQYVAYCFAEVKGYSKFSSYVGSGSTDGSFVFTGFSPAWVLLKRTNATQEWQIYDNQRDPFNVANHKLEPNSTSAESILTTDNNLDFLSNGFKLRQGNGGMNGSGSNYIYMAFAESPFKTATAR